MPIRVALVEDDEILLEAFRNAVQDDPALALSGQFNSAESFLESTMEPLPDVVIMDINLPGISGVEAVRMAKARHSSMQFLMCTVQDDDDNLFQAIMSGATGYLLKDAEPLRVVAAVKELHAGGSPMSAGIARRVLRMLAQQRGPAPEIAQLTDRERQVLEELAQGYRYKEIADHLDVSMDTVRTHIRNLYHKLHVSSRTDALNKLYPR
jgi:DNA-binding NarL/FixJ family response regulator